MSRDSTSRPESGVILEFVRNGQWLKVSAVCERTGLEAAATGPAHEPTAVERLAIAKLKRLIESAEAG